MRRRIITPSDFDNLAAFLMTTHPVADKGDLYTDDYETSWMQDVWNYGKKSALCNQKFAITADPNCLVMMTANVDETLTKTRDLHYLFWKCLYTMNSPRLSCSSYLLFADAATLRFVTTGIEKLYTGMIYVYGENYEILANKHTERVPDTLRRHAEPYIS